MNFDVAKQRSELYGKIRHFFDERNYLEVETPLLSEDLIPESTIDCFGTLFINEFTGSRQLYLVPSPEIYIKKLIAQGCPSVYEISKCFRNCEQLGKIHNPEFTMLEYYTMNFDEKDSLKLTLELLSYVGFPTEKVLVMTVREAVLKYTGLDLEELQNASELRKQAVEKSGLHIPGPESWSDTFNRLFCTFVEPAIPKDKVVFFTDYPAQIECLAKRQGKYRRRWEMYLNATEVANCYYEEDDFQAVSSYYATQQAKLISQRQNTDKVIPDADPQFPQYFKNFPKCSGVALGLDRLLMALYNYNDIKDVLFFPFK